MAWLESATEHFVARHDEVEERGAHAVLELLENTRARLSERLRTLPEEEVAVVLHGSTAQLHAAQPMLPLLARATTPAARRYVVGRVAGDTIHVLSPRALEQRGAGFTKTHPSRDFLRLAPAALYGRVVVAHLNPRLGGVR